MGAICLGEVNLLNRNVTIVIIILVLVVIAGYLVWLRSQYQSNMTPEVAKTEEVVEVEVRETPSASASAQEASASVKEATAATKAKDKAATSSSTKK